MSFQLDCEWCHGSHFATRLKQQLGYTHRHDAPHMMPATNPAQSKFIGMAKMHALNNEWVENISLWFYAKIIHCEGLADTNHRQSKFAYFRLPISAYFRRNLSFVKNSSFNLSSSVIARRVQFHRLDYTLHKFPARRMIYCVMSRWLQELRQDKGEDGKLLLDRFRVLW